MTKIRQIYVFAGEVLSLSRSFGVFVTGSVFQEDSAKWQAVLESHWTSKEAYADHKIVIGHSEKYYTTIG